MITPLRFNEFDEPSKKALQSYQNDEQKKQEACAKFIILSVFLLHQSQGNKASDIYLTLDVTLEELYSGVVKNVTYKAFDDMSQKVRKRVKIHLADWQEEYVCEGAGDESPFACMKPGDVIIRINPIPHAVFAIDRVLSKNDIYTTVPVTLYDYYYGRSITLSPPCAVDDVPQVIRIRYDRDTAVKRQAVVPGAGLPTKDAFYPRGDMYVYFEIRLPESLCCSSSLQAMMTRALMWKLFAGRRHRRVNGEDDVVF